MIRRIEVSHSVQLLRCQSSDWLLASAELTHCVRQGIRANPEKRKRLDVSSRFSRPDRSCQVTCYSLPSGWRTTNPDLPSPHDHARKYTTSPAFCQLHPASPAAIGGDEGTRTPDLLLAKEALSHLSYIPSRTRWAILDLNQRPFPYQRNALAN